MKNREIKVTYRGGFPTIKSLCEIADEFSPINAWLLKPSKTSYRYFKAINWQREYANDIMLKFIDYATEKYGIKFGEFREYNPKEMTTGQVKILYHDQ